MICQSVQGIKIAGALQIFFEFPDKTVIFYNSVSILRRFDNVVSCLDVGELLY